MNPAIFVDTNVPIYAAGRPHPLKEPCAQVLLLVADRPDAFVTSAEVLQELLHRYLALRLWSQSRELFDRFAELMQERIEPVHLTDVIRAAVLADSHPGLSARDLLHAATMMRLGVRQIVSADTGFDRLPEIERLDPGQVQCWRGLVAG